MAAEWFYIDSSNQQVGPIAESTVVDLLRNGEISDSTQMWRESFAEWLPLHSVKDQITTATISLQSSDVESDTRKCPFCGGEIKTAAKICKHCKRNLPPSPKQTLNSCSACGKPLKPNSKFCGGCGNQISAPASLSGISTSNIEVSPSGTRGYGYRKKRIVKDVDRNAWQNPDTLIFPDGSKKSMVLAIILTVLINGGPLYLRQTLAGIILVAFDIILYSTSFTGISLIPLIAIAIRLTLGTYKDVKAWNEGRPIKKWSYFWAGEAKPKEVK